MELLGYWLTLTLAGSITLGVPVLSMLDRRH